MKVFPLRRTVPVPVSCGHDSWHAERGRARAAHDGRRLDRHARRDVRETGVRVEVEAVVLGVVTHPEFASVP